MFKKDTWTIKTGIINLFYFDSLLNFNNRIFISPNDYLITQTINPRSKEEELSLNITINMSRSLPKNLQIDVYLQEWFYEYGALNPTYTFIQNLEDTRVSFNRSIDKISTSVKNKIIFPDDYRLDNGRKVKNRYYSLAFELVDNNSVYGSAILSSCTYDNLPMNIDDRLISNTTYYNDLNKNVSPAVIVSLDYKNKEVLVFPTPVIKSTSKVLTTEGN